MHDKYESMKIHIIYTPINAVPVVYGGITCNARVRYYLYNIHFEI